MTEPLVLAFAELEFVFRVRPEYAEAVRTQLRISPQASSDIVAAAGVASLLARGLCTLSGTEVEPTAPIAAVMLSLSDVRTHTEAVGWIGEQMVLAHLYTGPSVGLVMLPAAYGQFCVELLEPAEPLVEPVIRFLDRCSAGTGEAAVAIRSTTAHAPEVSIAIARDDGGTWFVSDSAASPGRGVPTTRDGVVERLTDLLGPRTAVARG